MDWFSRATAFAQAHFARKLTVEEVAAYAGRSVRRLEERFREVTGASLSDYLLGLRVAEAKRLLSRTAMPIAEIARAAGFSRPDYFSSRFRRATGLSPRRYRDQHRLPGQARRRRRATVRRSPVYRGEFSSRGLAADWVVRAGTWSTRRGALHGDDRDILHVGLLRELPPDFCAEFRFMRCEPRGRAPGAAAMFTVADGSTWPSRGYVVFLGDELDRWHRMTRRGQHVAVERGSLSYDTWHDVALSFRGDTFEVLVDGATVLTYTEAVPLPWKERSRLTLGGWDATLRIRDLHIYSLPRPGGSHPGEAGDARILEGDLQNAIERYEKELPRANDPGTEAALALRLGVCYDELGLGVRARGYLSRYVELQEDTLWTTIAELMSLQTRLDGLDDRSLEREVRRLLAAAGSPARRTVVFDFMLQTTEQAQRSGNHDRVGLLARIVHDSSDPLIRYAGRSARIVADLLLGTYEYAEALEFVETALRGGKIDQGYARQLRVVASQALICLGRFDEAQEELDRLAREEERPLQGQVSIRRAVFRQARGDLAGALEVWSETEREFADMEGVRQAAVAACAQLLTLSGRADEANARISYTPGERHAVTASIRLQSRRIVLAITGRYQELLASVEEHAQRRAPDDREAIRDALLLAVLLEIVGDQPRSTRLLEVLDRTHSEGRMRRWVAPARFLLGRAPYEEIWRDTKIFCLFAMDTGSSSLFYMLALALRRRGDEKTAKELFRLAVKADPYNYWPALLARRELGQLTPAMRRFLKTT